MIKPSSAKRGQTDGHARYQVPISQLAMLMSRKFVTNQTAKIFLSIVLLEVVLRESA